MNSIPLSLPPVVPQSIGSNTLNLKDWSSNPNTRFSPLWRFSYRLQDSGQLTPNEEFLLPDHTVPYSDGVPPMIAVGIGHSIQTGLTTPKLLVMDKTKRQIDELTSNSVSNITDNTPFHDAEKSLGAFSDQLATNMVTSSAPLPLTSTMPFSPSSGKNHSDEIRADIDRSSWIDPTFHPNASLSPSANEEDITSIPSKMRGLSSQSTNFLSETERRLLFLEDSHDKRQASVNRDVIIPGGNYCRPKDIYIESMAEGYKRQFDKCLVMRYVSYYGLQIQFAIFC